MIIASYNPPKFLEHPLDWFLFRLAAIVEYDKVEWWHAENFIFMAGLAVSVGITALVWLRIWRPDTYASAKQRVLRRLPRFSLRSLILLVALAGSGYGLWLKWEPWVQAAGKASRQSLIEDGTVKFAADPPELPEAMSKLLDEEVKGHQKNSFSWPVVDVERGVFLIVCTRVPTKEWEPGIIQVRSLHGGELIHQMAAPKRRICEARLSTTSSQLFMFHIIGHTEYRRQRPEPWWGVAMLAEFWLTLILAGALIWSMRRDRLNLKTSEGSHVR